MAVRGSRINVVYAVSYADRGTKQLLADDRRVRSSVRQTSAQMSQSASRAAGAGARATAATNRQARAHTQLAGRARGAAAAENAEARASRASAAAHSRAHVTASRQARSYDQIARSATRAGRAQRAATTRARAQVGAAGASARATAGFAGAFGIAGAIRQTVQFDKAMRNVNSLAGLGEKRFQALSKEVRQLGGRTAQMPAVLAEGLYDIIGSGFKARDAMTVLSASAKAASAGLTTTDVSAKVVSGTLNAYRMNAGRAGHVADVLFRTVDKGAVSFEELAQSIGPAMPMAVNLGVSLESLGGAISTMTKQGIDAPETMTALRGAMTAMSKPSEDMKQAFDTLGVDGAEQLVKRTGSLQGALQALAGTTDGSTTSLSKMFGEVRGRNAVLALTGKNARKAAGDLKSMDSAAGATDRATREQRQSTAWQWEQLKAKASNLGIAVTDRLLPALNKGMQGLLDFGRAHPTIAKVAGAIVGVGVALKVLKFARALSGIDDLAGGLRRVGQTKAGQAIASNVIGRVRGIPRLTQRALGGMRNLMSRLMGRAGTAGGSAIATNTASTAASTMPAKMRSKRGTFTAAGSSTGRAMGRSAGTAAAASTVATASTGVTASSKGGRLRGAFRGAGAALGPVMAAAFLAPFVDDLMGGVSRAMDDLKNRLRSSGDSTTPVVLDVLEKTNPYMLGRNLRKKAGFRFGGAVPGFASGGQVVALSPGELGIEPGGRTWTVPGQRVPADNFFTRVPTGTEIFTDHGQDMLASGASRHEALADQVPHFAKGGQVKALNRRFPAHTISSSAGKTQLSSRGVRAAAEFGGFTPGRAKQADQIAIGESNRFPGIISSDGGHGLLQMTPRVWGAEALGWMNSLGGLGAMRNPIKNMKMAKRLFDDAGGWTPWYGTGALDRNMNLGAVDTVLTGKGAKGKGLVGRSGRESRTVKVALPPRLELSGRLPSASTAWGSGYESGIEGGSLGSAMGNIVGAARANLAQRSKEVTVRGLPAKRRAQTKRGASGGSGGFKPGGGWGGSEALVMHAIRGYGNFRGYTASFKRPYNTGSGMSDHYTGSKTAFAADIAPGDDVFKTVRGRLNMGARKNSWNTFTNKPVSGYRAQLLWHAPDGSHKDHNHLGIRKLRRGGIVSSNIAGYQRGGAVDRTAAARRPRLGATITPVSPGAAVGRDASSFGEQVRQMLRLPTESRKIKDALRRFGESFTLLDDTSASILRQRTRDLADEARELARDRSRRFRGVTGRQLRRRAAGLREDDVTRRERPRLRRIGRELATRRELRGVRGELRDTRGRLNADVPDYRGLERMERSLGRRIGRLGRGKETRDQRVAIRRLEVAQRVVQTELGRRTGLLVRGVEKQAEALERARTRLSQVFRRAGVDEAASYAIEATAALTAEQHDQLKDSERRLTTALKRSQRRGNRSAVADITERLKGVRDEIAETATSWAEQIRSYQDAIVEQRRTNVSRWLRWTGTAEDSSAGIGANLQVTASELAERQHEERELVRWSPVAQRSGNRAWQQQIALRLQAVRDQIAETATSWMEQMRDWVRAGAQERVDLAAHGSSIASLRVQRFELEQQLAGTYETGGQARADQIRTTILPALLAEQQALQAQLAAASSIGDAVLARQIAEALEAKLNEQLQAQLDIKEAAETTADNTEALKEFSGSTVSEFQGQKWVEGLLGVGSGV